MARARVTRMLEKIPGMRLALGRAGGRKSWVINSQKASPLAMRVMGLNSVRTLHTTKRMTAAMRKPVYIRRISSAVKGIFLVMALSSQHEIFL